MKTFHCLFIFLFFISLAFAETPPSQHQPTPEELQQAQHKNNHLNSKRSKDPTTPLEGPVPDDEHFQYLLVQDDSNYSESNDFQNLRKKLANNLPADMKLVVLTDASGADSIKNKYKRWISENRLIVVTDERSTAGGFWARDAFPIATYADRKKNVSLVKMDYFRAFESQEIISSSVNAQQYIPYDFTFVGGNLLADEEGTCFSVNSMRLFRLTETNLKDIFGCKTVHLMPHTHGIGDIDEVIKPLSGKRILTSAPDYVETLKSWGYEVIELPALPGNRTYANATILNGTVFMPVFEIPEDEKATKVYESLGYKVIPVRSNTMSDRYAGSVHCQTMAYPPMELHQLLKNLNLTQK